MFKIGDRVRVKFHPTAHPGINKLEGRTGKIEDVGDPNSGISERSPATLAYPFHAKSLEVIPRLKVGDKVRITLDRIPHPDLVALQGSVGKIEEVGELVGDAAEEARSYTVAFDPPLGPRGWLNFYPLYAKNLEVVPE
jgi:ribosomal protein L21E